MFHLDFILFYIFLYIIKNNNNIEESRVKSDTLALVAS